MVSSIFREILLGRLTDMVVQKSVPMQRGARFVLRRSAAMARFSHSSSVSRGSLTPDSHGGLVGWWVGAVAGRGRLGLEDCAAMSGTSASPVETLMCSSTTHPLCVTLCTRRFRCALGERRFGAEPTFFGLRASVRHAWIEPPLWRGLILRPTWTWTVLDRAQASSLV